MPRLLSELLGGDLSPTEVAAERGHNYSYLPKTTFPVQIGKSERLNLRGGLHSGNKPGHRGGFWPKAEQEPADPERANAGLVDDERAQARDHGQQDYLDRHGKVQREQPESRNQQDRLVQHVDR